MTNGGCITLMPESAYGCKSEAVNVSGSLNHFCCLGKSRVRTLSMSMTVVRRSDRWPADEYSVDDWRRGGSGRD